MPFLRFRIHPSASMVTARAVPYRSDVTEASGGMVHAASRSGLVVGPGITVRGGYRYSGHGMPFVAVLAALVAVLFAREAKHETEGEIRRSCTCAFLRH